MKRRRPDNHRRRLSGGGTAAARAAGPGLLFLLVLGLIAGPAGPPPLRGQEVLTLEKALEIAYRNAPAMQSSRYRLEISERNLKARQAGLKSQFSLTVTPVSLSNTRTFNDLTSQYYNQSLTKSEASFSIQQPIKWTDGTLTVTNRFNWQEAASSYTGSRQESTFSNSLFLRLNQPFFTYNRTQMEIRELELALENAQLNHAVQKLQIERQVTQQFLNLYYLLENVKIAQEELKNSTESYTIIEAKVQAGISAREELYQADLTRANSEASLENKQIQYENAVDGFKVLVGIALDEEIAVVTDIRKKIVEVGLDRALSHGLDNRMELRQQDIAIVNALNDVIRAGAQNEFRASLDVTLGLTGTDNRLPQVYQSPNTDRVVAVTLNIPLWDWGEKQHRIASSQAQVGVERLSAQEEKNQIQLEIREAVRNLKNQERQIEIAEKNVTNAELTYEINLERYRNGDLNSKDMQFYQLQLSQQRLAVVSALINYKLALLDIKIRSLWDFETGRSILSQL